MKRIQWITALLLIMGVFTRSDAQGITATSESPFAKLGDVGIRDVRWTGGFWGDRFRVCRDSMVPNMWRLLDNTKLSHAFENFRIAAGLDTGSHEGPPFMDGDFYKWLEAAAAVYAVTRDKGLDSLMDSVISVIGKAQRPDGYLHTPTIIRGRKDPAEGIAFRDPSGFEAYNMGHLMTAACIYFWATGKRTLLKIAEKAVDCMAAYYKHASPDLARSSVCPSHYMGLVELYRTTRNKKYLELAEELIDLRSKVTDGTDQNQDRIPFRDQTTATGHAVRANYLYAGVADVYMETGDTTLKKPLDLIWNDVVHRKIYVTGGCGALYDGVSPDGTSYSPPRIQQVHQAYGRDYQLPNFTAHDETCANIGNVMWNWRMFLMTGEARYMDVLELALYNSVLSGISLNGKDFLYANPLATNDRLPFHLRWSKDRVPYIGLSFCCPPNVVRTIAESSDYAYSLSQKGLWVNLYGSNRLATTLRDGAPLRVVQQSNYPWDGRIQIRMEEVPSHPITVFVRIPGWARSATVSVNGDKLTASPRPGSYFPIRRQWKAGDRISLSLPMPTELIQANPLVEETRNQVAVKRGPLVYCLESSDLPGKEHLLDIEIPRNVQFKPVPVTIADTKITALEGEALLREQPDWKDRLYRPIGESVPVPIPVKLIPYFAWGNDGHTDMEVWIPLGK